MAAPPQTVEVFISYSSKDQALRDELEKHLAVLEREGQITIWSDSEISAGSNWATEIQTHLNTARMILLLVSPDYVGSDWAYGLEMKRALERHDAKQARVIPIILRPCPWQETPFGKLQALPSRGRPITEWPDHDAAYSDIVRGIRKVVQELLVAEPYMDPSPAPITPDDKKPDQPKNRNGDNNTSDPNLQQGTQHQPEAQQFKLASWTFEKDALEEGAITDRAVRRVEEDLLGFDVYVQALSKFIASPDTSTPLTIGIDGQWGSGKTSLMQMIRDTLDPKPNFRSWMRDSWTWLKWFILLLVTLPVWIFGKLLLWIGGGFVSGKRQWFQELRNALSYDPTSDLDVDLKTSSKHIRFWARIAARHCPMLPQTHPTIWFNAWKFDQEEQLWAALALALMDQIKQRYDPLQRLIFWFRLTLRRFLPMVALWNIIKRVLIPIVLGFIAWKYDLFIKDLPEGTLHGYGSLLSLGKPLIVGGALLSGILQVIAIAKDPFQISVKDAFDKPDYKEKIGFLGSFDKDFSNIVSLVTRPSLGWKPRKLVIFIDDLDRCEPPKSIDIIEGINLFLDSEGCVFVLGMDSAAVVASIETKYKDVFEKMKKEMPGMASPGRLFLDKIIQVPLSVPPPTEGAIERLVEAITKRKISSPLSRLQQSQPDKTKQDATDNLKSASVVSAPLPPTAKDDRASYAHKDVIEAIKETTKLLTANPRQVKRFVNLFRVSVYLADECGMLKEYTLGQQQIGLNLKRLATWVAWSIRWSEIVKYLTDEVELAVSDLRGYLAMIAKLVEEDGCWVLSERAVQLYPSKFEKLKTSPNTVPYPVYEELVRITSEEEKKNPTLYWYLLPWREWLRDHDFLRSIKQMEAFWQQPEERNGVDLLANILRRTGVTFPSARIITSNEKSSAEPETSTAQKAT